MMRAVLRAAPMQPLLMRPVIVRRALAVKPFTMRDGSRVFTRAEVARHNTDEDLYVIIDGRVYDLSQWINFHPGGRDALLAVAGKDATEMFNETGHSLEARARMREFELGVIDTPLRFHGSEYAERKGEV